MSNVRNLFIERDEARRYNLYRPAYHHILAQKLFDFFGQKIPYVLDVACGTGHSTNSLSKICENIVGCDASDPMLNEARLNSKLMFIQSKAEKLPFSESEFDYLNVSMAFQWFDQIKFLKEAKRVLKNTGFLGIDNYGFIGKMIGNETFLDAYKNFDQLQMRSAVRNKNYPDETDLAQSGFKWMASIDYDHEVQMSKETFVNYLLTRSNFLELELDKRKEVTTLALSYYEDQFKEEKRTLCFRGQLRMYQPIKIAD